MQVFPQQNIKNSKNKIFHYPWRMVPYRPNFLSSQKTTRFLTPRRHIKNEGTLLQPSSHFRRRYPQKGRHKEMHVQIVIRVELHISPTSEKKLQNIVRWRHSNNSTARKTLRDRIVISWIVVLIALLEWKKWAESSKKLSPDDSVHKSGI